MDSSEEGLLSHIHFRSATALVVANVIGAGVFTTTGFQAADLGNPTLILLLWLLGGVLAYCGALSFAELGAAMPSAGGEYIYLRETYGRAFGFMSAFVSLLAGCAQNAVVSETDEEAFTVKRVLFVPYRNMYSIYGLNKSVRSPFSGSMFVTEMVDAGGEEALNRLTREQLMKEDELETVALDQVQSSSYKLLADSSTALFDRKLLTDAGNSAGVTTRGGMGGHMQVHPEPVSLVGWQVKGHRPQPRVY